MIGGGIDLLPDVAAPFIRAPSGVTQHRIGSSPPPWGWYVK